MCGSLLEQANSVTVSRIAELSAAILGTDPNVE